MKSTIPLKHKWTTRTTLIITMTKQMLSTLRGTRFCLQLYFILFFSSGESVDYSNIIQTIVADAADDITEEPPADQESGIELDELIDRRKVFFSFYPESFYKSFIGRVASGKVSRNGT